jgi:RecA-family ATPase
MKSWLGLDFAVSVASGTPALDRFRVEAPGTALIYLAEDGLPQVRGRLEAICRHRGISLGNLNVAVITEPTVRLDAHRDQLRLRATIDHFRPRLLVLDPLVRLHSLDENSSQDISRLLGYLRDLQRSFDLALIVVHL